MKPDIEALQGTWNIVSLEMDGHKYPAAGSQIAIEGGRFTGRNMGAEYSGTMAVNQSSSPKSFDLLFETGPEKGSRSLGIYELDGNAWKICLGLTGKTRPAKFATAPDSGHALETLKRSRGGVERQLPVPDERAEPVAELEGDWFMASCRQDGQPMDPRFVGAAKREFRGNTTTLSVSGRSVMKSRFTADPARKTIVYGDLGQHGIYTVSGDTLQTCLVAEGEPLPADFTVAPGDGRLVSEWTRNKGSGGKSQSARPR
jgi:uncharacterized protein (TIGR03067 family)